MTMHKAKGLQFDHVVLPSLGRMTRGGDKEVLSWLTLPAESGDNEMIISPIGPRSEIDNDPLHRFIEATETDKSKMELDRLLYVACTRAIKSLHLIGNVAVSADGEQFNDPYKGSLLSRLWPAIEMDYANAFPGWLKSRPKEAPPGDANYLVKPRLQRFREKWVIPTPVPMAADVTPQDSQAGETEVEYYWVGSALRHAGTIVHRWFQRISDEQLSTSIESLGELRDTTRRWALDLGVNESQIEEVCQRAETALRGVLADEKGCWVLYGEGSAELPITGVVDGKTESVIVDRVRIDEQGVHWIVDYKTSTHEGGDLEGFLHQESERYRPQLEKYAAMYSGLTGQEVRTALYFPLLQEFCEVKR
jgi:ATP-dependent exoDNAse (exonuclease V) beta subunit